MGQKIREAKKSFANFSQLYKEITKKLNSLEKRIHKNDYIKTSQMVNRYVFLSQAESVRNVNILFNLRPSFNFDTYISSELPTTD
jgi:hypothetical protein